jgi:hypothetical protein
MQMRRHEILFRLAIPFLFAAFYASVLLYLIFWPLLFLYGLVLCAISWIALPEMGKDIVAVRNGTEHSAAWMSVLEPLIERRAIYLDYDERTRWRRWSLPVQLFYRFGPKPIPELFMPHSLPAIIVLSKFQMPKLFTFGDRTSEPEKKLEQLRSLLTTLPTSS